MALLLQYLMNKYFTLHCYYTIQRNVFSKNIIFLLLNILFCEALHNPYWLSSKFRTSKDSLNRLTLDFPQVLQTCSWETEDMEYIKKFSVFSIRNLSRRRSSSGDPATSRAGSTIAPIKSRAGSTIAPIKSRA